jgi:hypothetical protein
MIVTRVFIISTEDKSDWRRSLFVISTGAEGVNEMGEVEKSLGCTDSRFLHFD